MQKININKVAIGFDYNEKKETNILNSFYVQAVTQASYNFPDMFGMSDIKFIFESEMTNGYGCSNRYLNGKCYYLSGSLNCGNFSLPSICSLDFSCPEKEEEEEEGCDRGALDQAKINFKLGKFCTKKVSVGADGEDASNRLQLNTGSDQAINGLELEFKNNESGDISATWFKGTTACACATEIGSSLTVTATAPWANAATTTIAVDPAANKELLRTLKVGDKFKDSNGDPLFGIGTYKSHTAAGVITVDSAVVTIQTGTLVQTNTAVNAVSVPIDGADTAGLVKGNAIYAGAAVPATLAALATDYLGDATQAGVVAHASVDLEFNSGTATACVDGDKIYQSSGAHFTVVPTAGAASATVTVELQNGNPLADDYLVDNNITGMKLMFKLGRFGSIGYEDIETDNSGTKTKDTTTCVRLGFCNSTDLGDLDQVTRGPGDILSNISLDWVNHENKIGNAAKTEEQIIALQYKLSDEMSLMYGQKNSY